MSDKRTIVFERSADLAVGDVVQQGGDVYLIGDLNALAGPCDCCLGLVRGEPMDVLGNLLDAEPAEREELLRLLRAAREEDARDVALADQALAEARARGEQPIPWESVREEIERDA